MHISAITLPEGVKPTITERDFTVATIVGRSAEEPAPGAAAAEAAEPGAEAAAGSAEAARGEGQGPEKEKEKKKELASFALLATSVLSCRDDEMKLFVGLGNPGG